MTFQHLTRRQALVAIAALAAAPAACARNAGADAVRVGSKNFTEELILGQLYQQALQAKGYKVSLNDSFPGVALINAALTFMPAATNVAVAMSCTRSR